MAMIIVRFHVCIHGRRKEARGAMKREKEKKEGGREEEEQPPPGAIITKFSKPPKGAKSKKSAWAISSEQGFGLEGRKETGLHVSPSRVHEEKKAAPVRPAGRPFTQRLGSTA